MKKIIISSLLLISSLFSKDTSLKYPIENFGAALQWNLFYDEFSISGKTGFCDGGKTAKASDMFTNPKVAVGFKTRIIEPVAIMESTNVPWFFVFLGINLGDSEDPGLGEAEDTLVDSMADDDEISSTKYLKFRNSRQDRAEKSTPFREAHIFRFPVFGLILKSNSMLCFDQGKISPLHFSELDPRWNNDLVAYSFDPMIINMINPSTMVASILDCLAASTSQGLDYSSFNPVIKEGDPGFLENSNSEFSRARVDDPSSLRNKAINSADVVRNTMMWSNGCVIGNVGSMTGWLPAGNDPLAATTTLLHRIINFMHIGGLSQSETFGFKKSSNIAYRASIELPNNVDSMCSEKTFPMIIKSQYKFQLAYPTVGKGTELGTTPPAFTSFKNVPGSKDSSAFFIWKKRDFYAGAYACGGSDEEGE